MISKRADKAGDKKSLQRDRMETKLGCDGWLSVQNDDLFARQRENAGVIGFIPLAPYNPFCHAYYR